MVNTYLLAADVSVAAQSYLLAADVSVAAHLNLSPP